MDSPDMGLLRGVIAMVTLATFLGIVWWAYRPRNRKRFEEDAWLAFDDKERARLREQERAREREGRDEG